MSRGWYPAQGFMPAAPEGHHRVFPNEFTLSSDSLTPSELFRPGQKYGGLTRYVHRRHPNWVLIFTDGSCPNNGQWDAKAGWAFVDRLGPGGGPAVTRGPLNGPSVQTSNRAELQAVISALSSQALGNDVQKIVIATDSEYVAKGATQWAPAWVSNGWRGYGNTRVKNKDLWEMLLDEVERWDQMGISIEFWRIPRDENKVADAAARAAAEEALAMGARY
ncbi:RNase H domain protein [Xylaria telfairii]|nr:RNase H domain protein [Xylaria telfairii]